MRLSKTKRRDFLKKLMAWYACHVRDLPWRGTRSAYAIWVSEVILQQTRVAQGLPYYERFMSRYPDILSLAASDEDELLSYWQGLGYYRRARNMHAAAKVIIEKHGGCFPWHPKALEAICGMGPYTAAAVASFAFDYPVAVLDGNVFRFMARYVGIESDISRSATRAEFMDVLEKLMDKCVSSRFNQAMMEFGALQCVPRPTCNRCPLRLDCYAYTKGCVSRLPVKAAKKELKKRFFHYLVLQTDEGMFFRKRKQQDIWLGLYDYFLIESMKLLDWQELKEQLPKELETQLMEASPEGVSDVYRHVLTHQLILARFYVFSFKEAFLLDKGTGLRLVPWEGIPALAKPVLITRYLKSKKYVLF